MRKPDYAVTPGGVPILRPKEIDSYAEKLIGEFSPLLLQKPAPFDIQHFIRGALDCRLTALPLCGDGSISAQTFFRESVLEYRDEKGYHRIRIPENTIVLNRDLLAKPTDARFCLAHEAGHFLLHGDCYRVGISSLSDEETQQLEQQADRFAYALLMNAPTLMAYWGSMQTYLDAIYGENADLANHYAAAVFANHYRVSRYRSGRRLEQLGMVRRNRSEGFIAG